MSLLCTCLFLQVSELLKEAEVNLLQLNAVEAAMQIMVEDFTVFRQIGEEYTPFINMGFGTRKGGLA